MVEINSKEQYRKKLYYSCKDQESDAWGEIAAVPAKIMFELVNSCNHRCIFCSNRVMKRKTGYMDIELYKDIAIQAHEAGVKEIALYTTGESLLHPKIVDFVSKAKKINFSYIYLSTNGVLLDTRMSEALLRTGLDSLRFSINAGTRESYKQIHGKDDFDLVLSNLREYDRIRKKLNSSALLSVSCVLTNRTVHEKKILEDLVKPYVDAVKWTEVRIQGGNMLKIIRELSVKRDDERTRLKPCGLLWNGMHVDYKGNMTLCCVDFNGEMLVGSIKERGLLNCWNGSEMREYRRLHLSKSLDGNSLCYRCLTGSNSP